MADTEPVAVRPTRFDPLPPQPEGVPFPGGAWPAAEPEPDVDRERLTALMNRAFDSESDPLLARTFAVAIAHRGRLVAENYGLTAGPDTELTSWSMAKSVTHAIVGMMIGDGLLDLHAPAPVAEWADDERSAITLHQLLQMTSGLEFNEDYVDDQASDTIEMLFGRGQRDTAGYARSKPLAHAPGTVFNYSSGTTNIASAICSSVLPPSSHPNDPSQPIDTYLHDRLVLPLWVTSACPRFDAVGTFIGSSFLKMTAQDFLKFGLLYLRDGVWNGDRLLPEGWVDHARTPVEANLEERFWYGAHWWLWDDRSGAFAAHGYEGQYTVVVPGRDLVLVRLGKTPADDKEPVLEWLQELIECFPEI